MSLRMRRPDREDMDSIVDWLGDPAFQALFFVGDDRVSQQIGQQVLGMAGGAASFHVNPAGQFILEDETAIIGLVSIQDLSWRNRSCSADMYLLPSHREAHETAEAYRALILHCFDEINLHRVTLRVPANAAALHEALLGMGARKEVMLRGHVMTNGEPKDLCEFGVLRHEFTAGATRETN